MITKGRSFGLQKLHTKSKVKGMSINYNLNVKTIRQCIKVQLIDDEKISLFKISNMWKYNTTNVNQKSYF